MHKYHKILQIPLDDYTASLFFLALSTIDMSSTHLSCVIQVFVSASISTHSHFTDAIVELFTHINTRLKDLPSMNLFEISQCIYALQKIEVLHACVLEIILTLTAHLLSNKAETYLTSHELSRLLYGLHNLSNDTPVIKRLIEAILPRINRETLQLNAQGFGMCFFGMKSMVITDRASREVFVMLVYLLDKSCIPLTPLSLSMIISSIRNKGTSTEVLSLLSVINKKTCSALPIMDSLTIGSVMYGLQEQSLQNTDVRSFISTMNKSLVRVHTSAVIKVLCTVLWMSVQYDEVAELFNIASVKMNRYIISEASEASRILYALQRMDSYSTLATESQLFALSRFVGTLPRCIGNTYKEMKFKEIGLSLFGLRNCYLCTAWKPILKHWLLVLFKTLSTAVGTTNLHSFQQLLLVFSSSNSQFYDSITQNALLFDYIRIKALLLDLAITGNNDRLADRQGNVFKSRAERLYSLKIQKVLLMEYADLSAQFNDLFHGFEMDVLLFRNGKLVLNIEIDGSSHLEARKQYFSSLRDEYLRSKCGVSVVRVNVCGQFVQSLNDEACLRHVQTIISENILS